MTENLKKFLEAVSKDEALQAKVNALESNKETAMAGVIALAKELGIELTEADFAQPDGEISEDELETINGGGCPTAGTVNNSCYCAAAGGGGGKQKDEDIWGCACVAYGQGGDAKDDHTTCMCVLYGHGEA
ncbi:MAG: Nif11-like leader peptide family RiPP precursor [Oscillospiraceae bacterium]|nr:Nif11-like leader peptide family RiPP precursor [Oscillospiraceae bacterium]